MVIKEVQENDKQSFNKVATHPLQSWEWGEFRKEAGNQVVRLGVYKEEKMTDAMQLMLHKIPLTNYKIGTLIKGPEPTQEILDLLKETARKENLLFIKLEPNVVIQITNDKQQITNNLENSKFKTSHPSQITNHPEKVVKLLQDNKAVAGKTLFTPTTFWINLIPSEEELLKSFHSKTRYNIRLAQKKGVRIIEDNSDEAFERYLKLVRETVERQGFYAHTEKYHRLMWKFLHQDMVEKKEKPIAHLLSAIYQKEIITTWIVFVWHGFLYYPYGASTDRYKDVMANNLMMWEAIRFGKRLGLKTFDLWGREEGKGFTKFKEGYNPQVIKLLGTWDLPTTPLYPLYTKAESIRWQFLRLRTKFSLAKPRF